MYYNEGIKNVFKSLKSSELGLSSMEAEKRLERDGQNVLEKAKKKNFFVRFFAQMKDLMIIILITAAVVSAIIAVWQGEYLDLIDSAIILIIVLIDSTIGVIQEKKADNSVELLKKMSKTKVKVLRDGEVVLVNSEDIVVGDVVLLEAGDIVPADIRLFETHSLSINESTLTGESLASDKNCDKQLKKSTALADVKNMAFSSTFVTYGRGKGVVVSTGMNSEVGKIASALLSNNNKLTPLQNQLTKFAKMLSIVVMAIVLVIFVAELVKNGISLETVIYCFMSAISLAVAAIPEGLTAIVTVILAIGISEMSKQNAIIKNLSAVETLGCCQIICSDKTGTITTNKMTVRSVFTMTKKQDLDNLFGLDKSFDYLKNCMTLCNDAKQNENQTFIGDPTEIALIECLKHEEIDYKTIASEHLRVDELPFDSERKMMTTINRNGDSIIAYTKGAVDKVLPKCDKILIGDEIRDVSTNDINQIIKSNKLMAEKAERVLAFAFSEDCNNLEQNMVFVGLCGIIDPPRQEVKEAVQTCVSAGIKPVMITGDHIDTAIAIAKEVGIYKKGDVALTGEELDKLSDKEFYKILNKLSVVARVSPENKVRIVKAYQNKKYVVAMTGDGVNDAPSIKQANVGVGMGINGTDVSKEVADVVLADDNFASIVGAVKQGRKIYANIQKVIKYLLSSNIAEVLSVFIGTIFLIDKGATFLTPIMILWINLLTDSLPALTLAYEKPDEDIMNVKPRQVNRSIIGGRVGFDICLYGILQTILTICAYLLGNYVFNSHLLGVTMAFITLSLIQLFHVFNCKSNSSIFSKNLFDNIALDLAVLLCALFVILPVYIPIMAKMFGLICLPTKCMLSAVILAMLIIPMVEIEKLLINKKDK